MMKKIKNPILVTGLSISVFSLFFNAFILTKSENQKNVNLKEIDYYRARNSVLYSDITNAELHKFFTDFYSNWMSDLILNNDFFKDSINIQILHKKRDASLVRSLNYAFNSTVPDPTKNLDSSKLTFIDNLVSVFNIRRIQTPYKGFNNVELDQMMDYYYKYDSVHVTLIKKNNDSITSLLIKNDKESNKLGWLKSIGMMLQVIGLILVFLKDLNKTPMTNNVIN